MNAPHSPSNAPGPGRAPALALSSLSIALLVLLTSCGSSTSPIRVPGRDAKRSAASLTQSEAAFRPSGNPVIFVHGTMGSHLVDSKTSRIVWGEFSRGAANDYEPDAIRGMALPMQRGHPLSTLRDDVVPTVVMNRLGLTVPPGIRLDVGYYDGAIKRFDEAVNGSAPGDRCIEFSYDWRRGCDENAARLSRFIQARKAEFVRRHGYPETMKFDLIAHSLGCLVVRYYLRFGAQPLPADGSLPTLNWAGATRVENVALLGSPNAGIPLSLQHLTHGYQVKPLFPKYEAAVVGTLPSIYQVLPRARGGALIDPASKAVLDPLDYDLWVRKGWGLANPKEDKTLRILLPHIRSASQRRAVALNHLEKCLTEASRLHAALDRSARKPRHLQISGFAGNTGKTAVSFLATPGKPRLHRTGTGDGVVPLASAMHCPSRGTGAGPQSCWDHMRVFEFTHAGLACEKQMNQHVIGLMFTDR